MQNQKILEELQQQKQRLRMQLPGKTTPSVGTAQLPTSTGAGPLPVVPALPPAVVRDPVTEAHHLSSSQRAALQHAHTNSFGYFITQDSSFGNLILPVLPRPEGKS